MDQAQQPKPDTCTADKHRSPWPTWHRLSRGIKDTLCCVNMAVLLLETALWLKAGSFAKGRWWYQATNSVQNLVLHNTWPLALRLWGNGVLWHSLRHYLGQVQGVSLGFSIEPDSRASSSVACKTTAITSTSTLHSPALSEGSIISESSRSVFEHHLSFKHWGGQGKYPHFP